MPAFGDSGALSLAASRFYYFVAPSHCPPGLGQGIFVAQTSASIGGETGIKTFAAAHCQCPFRVNRCVAFQPPGRPMSVVAPGATKNGAARRMTRSANSDQRTAAKYVLFNNLVCASKQCGRDGKAQSLGGLEVDHKFEFCRLLYGQIRRFGALEDTSNVESH